MSDRHVSRAELQASKELDVAISKLLPGILEKLPADIVRSVSDSIYDIIGAPAGRVPAELILRKKYELLIAGGHIVAFTPEQIAEANKKEENEPIR
jgi:hypothetical protein